MKSGAKNSPPRKPLPSEITEAIAFSMNTPAMTINGIKTNPSKCSAPCPDDITCGVSKASRPTPRPPSAGRSGGHIPVLDHSVSHRPPPAHDGDAKQRRQNPEQRGDGKVAAEDVANRADAGAKRQRRKSMGDEISRHRGDPDRRQAGRRISADHQLKGIERAGQRRSEQ